MIKAIAAINNKGYLGKDGKMMWRSSEDFKHFKNITMGGILIVGRKTFEIDLRGKTLPGRTTIVVGSGHNTLGEALQQACALKAENDKLASTDKALEEKLFGESEVPVQEQHIWVIGGKSIYDQMAPLVDELHLSYINDDQDGDTSFDPMIWSRSKLFKYYFDTNK